LGRYGDVLTIERQEETLSELETMGLHAVVETVKDAIPHQWEVDCPLPAVAEPHLVLEWFDEMAAKRKAFEERNSPPAS
jgi:hypothetical protein